MTADNKLPGEIVVENAMISSAVIEIRQGDYLTCVVYLRGLDWNTEFGRYILKIGSEIDTPDKMGWFLRRLFETVGVTALEALREKPCRVAFRNGVILRIGHFLEDKWFDPEAEFEDEARKYQEIEEEEADNRE